MGATSYTEVARNRRLAMTTMTCAPAGPRGSAKQALARVDDGLPAVLVAIAMLGRHALVHERELAAATVGRALLDRHHSLSHRCPPLARVVRAASIETTRARVSRRSSAPDRRAAQAEALTNARARRAGA